MKSEVIKNIFKQNLLRVILLGAIIGLLLVPIIGHFIAGPKYNQQMIYNTLDEAKRVGEHIGRQFYTILGLPIGYLVN
jgi:tetrahydromethanopterin S-methyltransferase subunit G